MVKHILNSLARGLTVTPFEEDAPKAASQQRTVKREALKTATYAVMHFVVAVCVAYALTWDLTIALSIGLIEPLVQTVAYFFHERGWSRTSGRQNPFLKMSTYAVMHFCVAVLTAFALTGDIAIALSIGLVEPMVQTVAYALHERGWSRADAKGALHNQTA